MAASMLMCWQAISDNTYALDDCVVEGADDAARAVLKDMREPPEEIFNAVRGSSLNCTPGFARELWRGLIDEILKDG